MHYEPEFIDELVALRRSLHQHPEVAFEEVVTAAAVESYLQRCNMDEIHTGIGQTGIVAVLHGNRPGKMIALRADMDALPMQEGRDQTEVEYCSHLAGRFHGCGHDGHTVMLLGAAKILAKHRHFSGTLVFIFQCAEENLLGAKAMLDDGLYTRFPFDEIYGLHNMPGRARGVIEVNQAATLTASDIFTLTLQGKGGHGAVPERCVDPIVMAARLIADYQTIISRSISPLQTATISFGSIQGGSSHNIIPDKVILSGTVRTYDPQVRIEVKQRMQQLLDSVTQGYGGKGEITYIAGCPSVINDDKLARELVTAFQQWRGIESCYLANSPVGPSEDFAFYLAHAPGVYGFLGIGEKPMCHHPHYDFDDSVIGQGIDWWINIAVTRLSYQR
ncbi:M20 metallopeptidase family protein [Rosenbergiella australiborealis]|uniref:M20 metallopeptidase family protein n=1 Tax=Rosenbergiella australiborealis TaxID=1544696 RepID=UPI001F4E1A13|nr:amidohydrolase [Rosenbergiella australiborealis]